MSELMTLAPIPFLGIFVRDASSSAEDDSISMRPVLGNYSALKFVRDHWILFGRYGGKEYYMDSSVFGQTSSVCGIYCILFLLSLVCEGERRAESLYSSLLPPDDAAADDPRRLASRELLLTETLQSVLDDDHVGGW